MIPYLFYYRSVKLNYKHKKKFKLEATTRELRNTSEKIKVLQILTAHSEFNPIELI